MIPPFWEQRWGSFMQPNRAYTDQYKTHFCYAAIYIFIRKPAHYSYSPSWLVSTKDSFLNPVTNVKAWQQSLIPPFLSLFKPYKTYLKGLDPDQIHDQLSIFCLINKFAFSSSFLIFSLFALNFFINLSLAFLYHSNPLSLIPLSQI